MTGAKVAIHFDHCVRGRSGDLGVVLAMFPSIVAGDERCRVASSARLLMLFDGRYM